MTTRTNLLMPRKRPSTPDSACEQDWTLRPGMESDLSDNNFVTSKGEHNHVYAITTAGGLTNDSDGDSGIVTVRHNQRTGSTSSTDTETSQENANRNLSNYVLENHYDIILRKGSQLKGNTNFQSASNGPVKGDHNILSSNNNLAKLSLFQPKDQAGLAQHQVRFDDELQLNEQSIRRSCRKLFAALYAQKQPIPESADQMPTCQHRISINIPVTNSSYPCCRTLPHQTCLSNLSNQNNLTTESSASQNPIKVRSNSVSDTRRKDNTNVYKLCQNVYSRKETSQDMVQVFARPAAVIPMTELNSSTTIQLPSENKSDCTLRAVDSSEKTEIQIAQPCNIQDVPSKDNDNSERSQRTEEFSTYHTICENNNETMGTPKSISMPQLQVYNRNSVYQGSTTNPEVEYAVVDKTKKLRKNEPQSTSYPCLSKSMSDDIEPPVPPKKLLHRSDFALYQGPSTKKTFMGRIHGFTKSAKSAIQRAFSTERIYRPQQEEQLDVSGRKRHSTFIKGLKNRVSIKSKKKAPTIETVRIESTSSSPLWSVDGIDGPKLDHVCGQLIQLNVDGSQVIELTRPQGKPFGFFVARGRVKNSRGVFVSRMRDQDTQKLLSGLVDVGDEILEIDGTNVKESDILEVNGLMAKKLTLLLTILPYICRKDI